MIRSRVEPERVLVGQRAKLTIEVLTRTWFLAAPDFPVTIDAEDAVVLRPDTFGVNYTERIGSDTYAVQARDFSIFPVAPGDVTVPPIEVRVVVARADGSRSDPVPLRTTPILLEAKVPDAARGLGLVPATRSLEVAETWSRSLEGLEIGDAVTRTVSQRIENSVAMVLPAPDLNAPEGIHAYPDRPLIDTETGRGTLAGSRVDTVTYVFERAGSFALPEVVVPWWDLDADRLQQHTLPAVGFEVVPSSSLAADHLAAPTDELENPAGSAPRTAPPWRTLLGALAACAVLVAAWRPIARVVRRLVARFQSTPDRERNAFERFRRTALTDDSEATYAALMAWLDQTEISAGAAMLRQFCDRLDDPALSRDLAALENSLYASAAPSESWSPHRLVKGVGTARRQLLQRATEGHVTGTTIPPLNPTRPLR
jgi:hypothetical protein